MCIRNEFAIKRGGKKHTNNPNKQSIGEYDFMHMYNNYYAPITMYMS